MSGYAYDITFVANTGKHEATVTFAEPIEDTPLMRRNIAVGLQNKRPELWGVSVKSIEPSEGES